jgi:hypothetical protein
MSAQRTDRNGRHFCDRLDAVREAAEEAATFFSWPGEDEDWDWEAALGLAQLDLPNLPRIPSSDQARSAAVPVRPEHIRQWRAAGEALAAHADDLAAFAAFADLEDAFEQVEALVMQLLTEVEIQRPGKREVTRRCRRSRAFRVRLAHGGTSTARPPHLLRMEPTASPSVTCCNAKMSN